MLHMKNVEFDSKLKNLKHHMVTSLRQSMEQGDRDSQQKLITTSDANSNAQSQSVAAVSPEEEGKEKSISKSKAPPGEIDYEAFCEVLEKAGLHEMKSRVVFSIFDTGNTGEWVDK
jgi:uncharacterized protein YbcV (DUF1398 family)